MKLGFSPEEEAFRAEAAAWLQAELSGPFADLRGITEGVGADDPEIGLIQFKVGTGGEAVAYIGEWDLAINKVLYKAFDLYLKRR